MAKRFTDTGKWDDNWFLGLPPKIKLAWNYLCDTCDGGGVAKISFGLISYRIGDAVTRDDFDHYLGDRIVWISEDQLWVPGYLKFQYKTLKIANHAHRGIMAKVISLVDGLPLNDSQLTLIRGWQESLETLKEKDIGKGLGKRPFEERECEGKIRESDIEAVYQSYPRKEGKTPGMKTAKSQIKDLTDLTGLSIAVDNYKAHVKAQGREGKHVLMWSTFMNQWRDWLDPSHGQATDFSSSTGIDYAARERAIFEGAS